MTSSDSFLTEMQEWVEVTMCHSMHSFIRSIKEKGFSMNQVSALFFLRRKRSCGVGKMAKHLGVTNAAASQMLERLVEQGLILRSEDPKDRRGKQIVLTDKGINLIKEGIKARQRWVADLIVLFTPEQREQIRPVLKILIEKTKQIEFYPGHPCIHPISRH